jgi:hypothetical protein
MSTQRFHVERLRLAGRSRLQAAGHHDEQREQVFVAQRDARLTVSGGVAGPPHHGVDGGSSVVELFFIRPVHLSDEPVGDGPRTEGYDQSGR